MERKKKSKRPATPGEDEFAFSHERTREERDAEGRANAIDVDAARSSYSLPRLLYLR